MYKDCYNHFAATAEQDQWVCEWMRSDEIDVEDQWQAGNRERERERYSEIKRERERVRELEGEKTVMWRKVVRMFSPK